MICHVQANDCIITLCKKDDMKSWVESNRVYLSIKQNQLHNKNFLHRWTRYVKWLPESLDRSILHVFCGLISIIILYQHYIVSPANLLEFKRRLITNSAYVTSFKMLFHKQEDLYNQKKLYNFIMTISIKWWDTI